MLRRHPTLAALLFTSAVVLMACGDDSGSASPSEGGRLRVVATTTQLNDFARIVGGDLVEVHGVLRPNADAHDFEPSPRDIDAMREADVLIRNGVGLEEWFEDAIESSGTDAVEVDASEGVQLRDEGDGDAKDPHIWHDPRNAKKMVANIADAYAEADPGDAEGYRANARAYEAQLDALDAEIAGQVGGLPDKKLVTNHDSFGYYVARYGFTFVGSVIPSFDSQAELSSTQVSELAAKVRDERVKAVFAESSLPPKAAETIGREAGVKVVAGDDALYGDSLGPAGSGADTYLGMMRHNTRTIVDNLR